MTLYTLSAVLALFVAPVAAILFGFIILRPLKPQWTHLPILLSCGVVTAASLYLAYCFFASGGLALRPGLPLRIALRICLVAPRASLRGRGMLPALAPGGVLPEDPAGDRRLPNITDDVRRTGDRLAVVA